MRAVMEALAARGVEFYLDDFGTGYSNLSSVVSLPLQYVEGGQKLFWKPRRMAAGERFCCARW